MSRVTVTNPYDLLTDENEDRTNVPAPKKEQKPAAPAAKPAAKPAAVAKPAASAKPAAPKADTKAPAKTDAKAAPKTNSANQAVKPSAPRDSNQNLQERDKESRAPRDKRDHRAAPTVDKKGRVHDRKSGTGRPLNDNQKKGGSGKGNYGEDINPQEVADVLKEEKVGDEKETTEVKEGETSTAAEGETKEGETPAAPKEEVVYTLDEYLAKRKAEKAVPQVESFKPRTVNADDFGAAGLVPLQREEQGTAPLQVKEKKEKKTAAAGEKKEEKPAGEKKEKTENLAAKLLTFASHQDQQYRERRDQRRSQYPQGERRDSGERSGERRPPRNNNNNRPPRSDAKGGDVANKLPVQKDDKDFPTLAGVKA